MQSDSSTKPIGNVKRHTEERPDSVVRGNIADELPKTLESDVAQPPQKSRCVHCGLELSSTASIASGMLQYCPKSDQGHSFHFTAPTATQGQFEQIKKECDDALDRALKAESALMELRDEEFIAKATLQRFMDWLAGDDKEFSQVILQTAKHPAASPSPQAPTSEPNPFEPEETTAEQDRRIGRMIRENADKRAQGEPQKEKE